MTDNTMSDRSEFQQRLQRRFAQLQTKGLPVNDAAVLALKMESGKVTPPIDLRQLSSLADRAQDAEALPDAAALDGVDGVTALFSSLSTLVLSHAADVRSRDVAQPSADSPSISLDWKAVAQTASAIEHSSAALDAAIEGSVGLMGQLRSTVHGEAASQQGEGAPPIIAAQAVPLLLSMPWASNPAHEDVLISLCTAVANWPEPQMQLAVAAFSRMHRDGLAHVVGSVLMQFIVLRLMATAILDDAVIAAVQVLDIAFQANERAGLIDRTAFHCDAINTEEFDLKSDYIRWRQSKFAFCAHAFMFEPAQKAEILRIENRIEMQHEFHDALLMSVFNGAAGTCPYFVLKVRRNQLLNDTVLQMRRESRNLKRPLKVKFIGEEGVDEGGITKEFFQLLTAQLLNEDYGMFKSDLDTRQLWFRSSQLVSLEDFKLLGSLIGLAIYNSVILEVTFSPIIYRKLLGDELGFVDLQVLAPAVHANLQKLRNLGADDFEGLGLVFQAWIHSIFEHAKFIWCMRRQAEQENDFGDGFSLVDLKEDGGNIPVTKENLEEYLQLYAHHLLYGSVEAQFDSFLSGFHQVCNGPAMGMFYADELELLVAGATDYDFHALESSSKTEGFAKDAAIIRWFWEVVHSYDEAQQRRLLTFVTGNDRVPINGLGALNPPLVIHKNGDHSDRLPTAHTCFNILMLPEYKDKASLEDRLKLAIQNAEGFGLQ